MALGNSIFYLRKGDYIPVVLGDGTSGIMKRSWCRASFPSSVLGFPKP